MEFMRPRVFLKITAKGGVILNAVKDLAKSIIKILHCPKDDIAVRNELYII